MVICKRVSQIVYLEKRLTELKESFDALHGKKREYDKEARILIGTCQKLGVGFNQPRINTLLLAADFEAYFIQTLGRSMRTPEVKPIIFDIVDKNSLLQKHWKTRAKVYIEHGGKIKGLQWENLEEKNIGTQSLLQKNKKDLPKPIL
jgi:superfamily II DNA or RNA helicase